LRKLILLKPYFRPYRTRLAIGMVAIVLAAVGGLAAPLIVGGAVDTLREDLSRGALVRYGALLLGVTFLQGIFSFTQRRLLVTMSRDIEYDLGNHFFGHLEKLHPAFFHRYPTGDLMARATNDLAAVRMVCGPAIMYTTNMVVTSIGALTLMAMIHPGLMLVSLLPLPLVVLASRFIGRHIHDLFGNVQKNFGDISAKVQENLSGVRVVRAYAQEAREQQLFDQLNERYVESNQRLIHWDSAMKPLIQFLLGLSTVGILAYGGRLMIAGQLTIGEFVTFNLFLSKMVWPMVSLGWVVNLAERASASLARIHEVLDTEPEIRDAPDAVDPGELFGRITVRGLTFRYQEERQPVLRDIRFEVEAGEKVALVGRTGSGKSTLLALLPRLYNPPAGSLRVDGVDVLRLPLARLRGSMAMVTQESFLFSDTIRGNIAFARPEASADEIREAATLAGLDRDLESFPQGLETMVGERGVTLSGGQKQRVALARALLRRPQILLLDDCLSAVDAETERQILDNLQRVFPGRTVFQVSHRISAVKDADLIVVLDDGIVSEQGTHVELVARGGIYADLHRRQQLEEELAAV
jgi:ATP-binding cassette subfamily B multidrug efflux pump